MKAILFSKEGVEENSNKIELVCTDYSHIDFLNIPALSMPKDESDLEFVLIDKRRYNLTNVINGTAFFKKEE